MNGDSWFDLDLRAFANASGGDFLLKMALRPTDDTARFGLVRLEGERVTGFTPRGSAAAAGLINAGVYVVRRALLIACPPGPSRWRPTCFPRSRPKENCPGRRAGFFIDIGVPEDYAAAQALLARHRRRPAVFFDRTGC